MDRKYRLAGNALSLSHDNGNRDVVHSTAPVRVMSVIGQRMPLTTTALGQAFMSRIPDDDLKQLITLLPVAPKSARQQAKLFAELETSRERGYAIDDEVNQPEVVCVGSAIIDVSGSPVAALSISGLAYRMRPRITEVGPGCAAAANMISVARGAPNPNGDQ